MKKLSQAGFTITELLVSTAIATIMSMVFVSLTLTYLASIMQSKAQAELSIEASFLLQAVTEDIRLADSMAATNTLTDTNAPTGGWLASDTNNILIINSPATSATNDIIYDSSTGYPYRNQKIYHVNGSTLYKRTLKNTAATGNKAVTSCPSAVASSACPPDIEYSKYISNLTFTYYDAANVQTNDPTSARSVRITLATSRKVFGKTLTSNNTIQATLRNY